MPNPVRVRFAPSPTGALHVGGARTAIYNWAFARRNGGSFILRIDDTDPERSTRENTAQIIRSLEWLGLDWDEGPDIGGPFGPYSQSERAPNYAAALERMKTNGGAYPCFCSTEELGAKRASGQANERVFGYDRTCRRLDAAVAAARVATGEPHVWRLAVPEDRGDIVVDDPVRGETIFSARDMDDFVLARGDGTPTYNFATVVDDADMRITHVIRGDDHLSNTPRQILVYESLGHLVPTFAHLSMIWGADGKKLSKRHGATSVEAFHDEGFVPEALLNYLALLGWSLDGETTIFSSEVLKTHFSLDRISKSPAIFDFEKLEWMNGVHIRELEPAAFVALMLPWIEEAGLASAVDVEARREWFLALAPLVSKHIKRMTEIVPLARFLFTEDIAIDPVAAKSVLSKEEVGRALATDDRLQADKLAVALGEENLLATYLREVNDRREHDFFLPNGYNQMLVEDGEWTRLCTNKSFILKKRIERNSYLWDRVIQEFGGHILKGTLVDSSAESVAENEMGLRIMAREPRLSRRVLAQAMIQQMKVSPTSSASFRTVVSDTDPQTAYVFLLAPYKDVEYHEYRVIRRELLSAYCFILAWKRRQHAQILGVATESGGSADGRSFDLAVIRPGEWTPEMEEEARSLQEKTRLLHDRNLRKTPFHADEYPKTAGLAGAPRHQCRSASRWFPPPCLQARPAVTRNARAAVGRSSSIAVAEGTQHDRESRDRT